MLRSADALELARPSRVESTRGDACLGAVGGKRACAPSIVALAAIEILAAAGTAAAQDKTSNYDRGATDTSIKIGNMTPYSGPASAYGVIGRAEAAYFRKTSQRRRSQLNRLGSSMGSDDTRWSSSTTSVYGVIEPAGFNRAQGFLAGLYYEGSDRSAIEGRSHTDRQDLHVPQQMPAPDHLIRMSNN
jgi:hypothetical protein